MPRMQQAIAVELHACRATSPAVDSNRNGAIEARRVRQSSRWSSRPAARRRRCRDRRRQERAAGIRRVRGAMVVSDQSQSLPAATVQADAHEMSTTSSPSGRRSRRNSPAELVELWGRQARSPSRRGRRARAPGRMHRPRCRRRDLCRRHRRRARAAAPAPADVLLPPVLRPGLPRPEADGHPFLNQGPRRCCRSTTHRTGEAGKPRRAAGTGEPLARRPHYNRAYEPAADSTFIGYSPSGPAASAASYFEGARLLPPVALRATATGPPKPPKYSPWIRLRPTSGGHGTPSGQSGNLRTRGSRPVQTPRHVRVRNHPQDHAAAHAACGDRP